LVAGEGWFRTARAAPPYRDGSPRTRFVFGLSMATRDIAMLKALRVFLGVGSLNAQPARRENWQPLASFSVRSHRAHARGRSRSASTSCCRAKRRQFEAWRDALYEYEERHPNRFGKGPSPCGIEGCDRPVRGRGLCRSHYYRATGY
jgi:hypothetical protein